MKMINCKNQILFDGGSFSSKLPSEVIPKLKEGIKDFARGFGTSLLDGFRNSNQFAFPNTHIWASPEVERWYP